ncbi:MAG TPA: YwiC-like family protein [Polyangiales bacterium]|nr:YwiC-like family protein [Polyangiales bacterium]
MATSERSMVPREHGAYAELLFPIATVLLGGSPTASTWLLAVAAIACFLSNEPLLVLLGERGSRTKREESNRAKRVLLVFVLIALGTGLTGLVLAPRGVQIAAGFTLLLGGGLVLTAVQGLERSMFGEALAAAALSSIAIPLGLSAGLETTAALAVALIWLIASSLGTSIVRLTIARTKSKTEEARSKVAFKRGLLIMACLVVVAVGVGAPFGSRVGLWVLAAAVPVALVVLAMAALRPSTRRLRLMGWSLVAANLCSLIAVVTTLKIIQDFEAVEPTLPFPMF